MWRMNKPISNQKTKSFRVGLYMRLSREDGDKEESNSVTSQREIIDQYLKNENENKLYDYYIDDGYSGTNFDRPEFQRMLEDIKNKKIDVILIKDFKINYIMQ